MLKCGQSHQQHLPAGTLINVESGEVTVHEAPQWLAENMVSTTYALSNHQSHIVTRSGWLCIHATDLTNISVRQVLAHHTAFIRHASTFLRALIK
jgi:hypothetical protein